MSLTTSDFGGGAGAPSATVDDEFPMIWLIV
jgi:hypothetical protein